MSLNGNVLLSSVNHSLAESTAAVDYAALPEVIIEPSRGWNRLELGELWRFRELISALIRRDVNARYQQTMVGIVWAVLQPSLMTIAFTIFMGAVLRSDASPLPYPVYAYSGLLVWGFFSTAFTNAGHSVVASERLLHKVYFPRLVIPFAAVGACLVDFVIGLGGLAVLLAWYQIPPSWHLLFLPLWLTLMVLAAAGVGTTLAALNVKYRDFRYLMPFLTSLWFFSTPTIFIPAVSSGNTGANSEALLMRIRESLIHLNPMNALIDFFRTAIFGGPLPWEDLGAAATVILALLVFGCYFFRHLEDRFADIV